MARKSTEGVEERKNNIKRNKDKKGSNKQLENNKTGEKFVNLRCQLSALGLMLREIPGDGNCLFRALGDQLEGHTRSHMKHRVAVVEYMKQNRKDFEPFVEDDIPFNRHMLNLAEDGTFAGNDAIVAFARLKEVVVVIHQHNSPMWQVSGVSPMQPNVPELHIAYHSNDHHYSSVRRIGDDSEYPANVQITAGYAAQLGQSETSLPQPISKPMSPTLFIDEDDENEDDLINESQQNIDELINRTGCKDLRLIQRVLGEEGDLESARERITQIMIYGDDSRGIWSENGSGTRIFGSEVAASASIDMTRNEKDNGVKPKAPQKIEEKKHLSNRQRQELKRQERKREAEERKREKAKSILNVAPSNKASNSSLSSEVECLSI